MTDIQQWLSDQHHDYAEGVAVFARYSTNKGMVRTLTKGSAHFWMGKLEYEMGKLAKQCTGRKMGNGAPRVDVARVPNRDVAGVHGRDVVRVSGRDAAGVHGRDVARRVSTLPFSIPEVIMSAKAEISSLYAIIDKMHRQLYDLGTGNDDKTVCARKRLLDKRHPIKSQAVKALGELHPDISQAQLYRYIDYAIRIWNPKNRLDREFLETVFVNKLMQEICREEATEESRSKNLATMQKYLASLPPESIDPSMLQKHDIYIQLNINGSNIDIPFEKLRLLTDETKRIAGALDQEITDVQAEEIMEG